MACGRTTRSDAKPSSGGAGQTSTAGTSTPGTGAGGASNDAADGDAADAAEAPDAGIGVDGGAGATSQECEVDPEPRQWGDAAEKISCCNGMVCRGNCIEGVCSCDEEFDDDKPGCEEGFYCCPLYGASCEREGWPCAGGTK